MPKELSVIILTSFNRSDLVAKMLWQINHTADVPCEIIVVDNGSTDDTPSVVTLFPGTKYFRFPVNKGIAPAWNLGVKMSTCPVVVILNNDLEIQDNHWMSKLVSACETKSIVGHNIRSNNPLTDNIPYVEGYLIATKRETFEDIGFFDEEFLPFNFEDAEFSVRAVHHGYDLLPVSLNIKHNRGTTITQNFSYEEVEEINRKNQELFRRKVDAYKSAYCGTVPLTGDAAVCRASLPV